MTNEEKVEFLRRFREDFKNSRCSVLGHGLCYFTRPNYTLKQTTFLSKLLEERKDKCRMFYTIDYKSRHPFTNQDGRRVGLNYYYFKNRSARLAWLSRQIKKYERLIVG